MRRKGNYIAPDVPKKRHLAWVATDVPTVPRSSLPSASSNTYQAEELEREHRNR